MQIEPDEITDILKKRMRLRFAVNDQYWQPKPGPVDNEFFVLAQKFDGFVMPITAEGIHRLEKQSDTHMRKPMDAFRASVQTWPDVVECSSLTGEMDYLLRVLVSDMAHYSRFVMDTLLKHPSVQDCKTSFVLDRVKATTAVPV